MLTATLECAEGTRLNHRDHISAHARLGDLEQYRAHGRDLGFEGLYALTQRFRGFGGFRGCW